MSGLETIFWLLVLCVLVLCLSLIRDWPRRDKPVQRLDAEWRMDKERERLKAAAIWKGYRRP